MSAEVLLVVFLGAVAAEEQLASIEMHIEHRIGPR